MASKKRSEAGTPKEDGDPIRRVYKELTRITSANYVTSRQAFKNYMQGGYGRDIDQEPARPGDAEDAKLYYTIMKAIELDEPAMNFVLSLAAQEIPAGHGDTLLRMLDERFQQPRRLHRSLVDVMHQVQNSISWDHDINMLQAQVERAMVKAKELIDPRRHPEVERHLVDHILCDVLPDNPFAPLKDAMEREAESSGKPLSVNTLFTKLRPSWSRYAAANVHNPVPHIVAIANDAMTEDPPAPRRGGRGRGGGRGGLRGRGRGGKCYFCDSPGHRQANCTAYAAARTAAIKANEAGSKQAALMTATTVYDDMAFFSDVARPKPSVFVDSLASAHITPKIGDLHGVRQIDEIELHTANGTVKASEAGTRILAIHDEAGEDHKLILNDCLFVPTCQASIFGAKAPVVLDGHESDTVYICRTEGQSELIISPKDATAEETHLLLRKVGRFDALPTQDLPSDGENGNAAMPALELSPQHQRALFLHRTLGHINLTALNKLLVEEGSQPIPARVLEVGCASCNAAKITKKHVPRESPHRDAVLRPGQRLSLDLSGPFPTKSLNGAYWKLTCIDRFSNHCRTFLLRRKADASDKILEYLHEMKSLGLQLQPTCTLQFDSEQVFLSQAHITQLESMGVRCRASPPYCKEKNGHVERAHRTIGEMARALLHDARPNILLQHGLLPDDKSNRAVATWEKFIGSAELLATAIYNDTPKRVLGWKSPNRVLADHLLEIGVDEPVARHVAHPKPSDKYHLFGATAYTWMPEQRRGHYEPRARKVLYIGYDPTTDSSRFFNPATKRVISAHHYAVAEQYFQDQEDARLIKILHQRAKSAPTEKQPVKETEDSAHTNQEDSPPCDILTLLPAMSCLSSEMDMDHECEPELFSAAFSVVAHQLSAKANSTPSPPTADPTSVQEALSGPHAEHWRAAMKEEAENLLKRGTWKLMKRKNVPEGCPILGLKTVLTLRHHADGSFKSYKAREAVKGYTQRAGIHYEETFAPASRTENVRMAIALAAYYDLELHTTDVSQAFTQSDVDRPLYTELPQSLRQVDADGDELVGMLKGALYGLKQASNLWWAKSKESLKEQGYVSLNSDPCFYNKEQDGSRVAAGADGLNIIVSHVDDFLHAAAEDEITASKRAVLESFEAKDGGEAQEYLSIHITRDRAAGTISLDQEAYAMRLLADTGMLDCNPITTPLEPNQKWNYEPDEKKGEYYLDPEAAKSYRSTVCRLAWLPINTRPDLCEVTSILQSCQNKPTSAHAAYLKRTLRFLKGTTGRALTYHRRKEGEPAIPQLFGISDASFNVEPEGRSRSGTTVFLAGAAIAWRSSKQRLPALSTCESETIATCDLVRDVGYFKGVLDELGLRQGTIPVFGDNRPSHDILNNPKVNRSTRHIALRYHFVRALVDSKEIAIHHIPTESMVADMLTKQLPRAKFETFTNMMVGNAPLPVEITRILKKKSRVTVV